MDGELLPCWRGIIPPPPRLVLSVFIGWYCLVFIGRYFGWYYCVYVAYFSKLAGTFFLRFRGTLFLKKTAGSHSKRGPSPPFWGKWGSRQICNTEKYQPSFPSVSVGIYRRNTNRYQPKYRPWYATLLILLLWEGSYLINTDLYVGTCPMSKTTCQTQTCLSFGPFF